LGLIGLPMDALAAVLAKIFLMALFGYIVKKTGIVDEPMQVGLSTFLVKAVLPVSVLASAGAEMTGSTSQGMGIVALAVLVYYAAAILLVSLATRPMRASPGRRKTIISMSVFQNTGFIGIPLSMEFLGAEGAMYAVIYNMGYQLFFYTYGMYLYSGSEKLSFRALLRNPVTIASFASLLIFLSPFRFPAAIQDTLSAVGNMTTPLSMMIVGCAMVGIRPGRLFKDRQGYAVSAVRMVIFPLLMLLFMRLLRVPFAPASALVLITALPSGTLNVVMAQQYNCEPDFASRTVVQTLILMAATVPLIMILTGIVLA